MFCFGDAVHYSDAIHLFYLEMQYTAVIQYIHCCDGAGIMGAMATDERISYDEEQENEMKHAIVSLIPYIIYLSKLIIKPA